MVYIANVLLTFVSWQYWLLLTLHATDPRFRQSERERGGEKDSHACICLNVQVKSDNYSHEHERLSLHTITCSHYTTFCSSLYSHRLHHLFLSSYSSYCPAPIVLQLLGQFRWNLMYYWDWLVWWNSFSFSFFPHLIHIQGRRSLLMWLHQKTLMVACIMDRFLSNLAWWQRLLDSTFWCQCVGSLPSFQILVVSEVENCSHFLANFSTNLNEI